MEPLGACLRQPVRERLDHDGSVVIVLGLVALHELVGPESRRNGERAHVVRQPGLHGGDVVRERAVRVVLPSLGLLAEHRQCHPTRQHDVVSLAVGPPEAVGGARLQAPGSDDLIEQLVRVGEQLASLRSEVRVVEDLRIGTLQLPRGEEERPVDDRAEFLERGLQRARAREGRRRDVVGAPRDRRLVLERDAIGEQRGLLSLLVLSSELRLELAVPLVEGDLAVGVEQRRDHPDHAGGVDDVDHGMGVRGRDADRGVLARRGRTADQQREIDPAPLHLLRDVDHLVEGRGDQSRAPDDVAAFLKGSVK